MRIELVAKEMSQKYNESELKWVLVLKRLEQQGYDLTHKSLVIDSPVQDKRCPRCLRKIDSNDNQEKHLINGVEYCSYCTLSILMKRKPNREIINGVENFSTH